MVGPVVRLELVLDGEASRDPIQAEIRRERFRELNLAQGDRVFIKLRRFDLFPTRIH
jgi:sulfate transport system ATP-binding protein